jgi:GTPase
MTKEHLGLALALQVPVFVVITKVDMCPPNVLEATISHLTKVLKSSGCRKIPMFVNSMEDVIVTADNFVSERWLLYNSKDTNYVESARYSRYPTCLARI